jgi:Glyoxalase-like domain
MGNPISLVLDCADPLRVGAFWRQVVGYLEEERRRIDAGVAPLVELGATVLRRNQDPDDWFVVMQDPEGNEFCLV